MPPRLKASLFVGFPADLALQTTSSPFIQASTISAESPYLHHYEHHDGVYLGKFISAEYASLAELDLLEANIYSLLKKIDPENARHQPPIYLISALSGTPHE